MRQGPRPDGADGDGHLFRRPFVSGVSERSGGHGTDAVQLLQRVEVEVRRSLLHLLGELADKRPSGNTLFFFACGHLDFESAVTVQNDEFKGSFHSSYSRLLNVSKTQPINAMLSRLTFRYVR